MKESMGQLIQYWPFIVPLLILQVSVVLFALVHIFRHENYRVGNRVTWVIVCVLFQLIGSVVYLTVGKEAE